MNINCSSSSQTSLSNVAKYGLTSDQYSYVKKETVQGGKLDYESKLDPSKLVVINDVAYNRRAAGLYTWALTIRKLGVRTADEAIALYEDITSSSLREAHRQAMRNAFESKTE
jgi:hypothetical protein